MRRTLYNATLRIARNFLETRENIKISPHPFNHINLGWFSWKWSKKKFFFSKKIFKMADSKKVNCSAILGLYQFHKWSSRMKQLDSRGEMVQVKLYIPSTLKIDRNFSQITNKRICFSILTILKYLKLDLKIRLFVFWEKLWLDNFVSRLSDL